MADLKGQAGELRFTIEIKRAATGETETHELIGKVIDDVGDSLNGGEERSDGRGDGADRSIGQA
jgi:hypothetical protein